MAISFVIKKREESRRSELSLWIMIYVFAPANRLYYFTQ